MNDLKKAIEKYIDDLPISHTCEFNAEENRQRRAFGAGVEFAQRWISVDDELPNYYQIVLADNGKYMAVVARVSDGDEEYYSIYGTDIIMSPDPIKWRPIELK